MTNCRSAPQHIAIIMDGNSRWAAKHNLSKIEGYRSGMKNTKRIILYALERGIAALSIFALSSENLKRPPKQTRDLLNILEQAIEQEVPQFHDRGAQFTFIGERSYFPARLRQKMQQAEALTAKNQQIAINIALNYGGKWDIVQACRKIATLVKDNQMSLARLDEKSVAQQLCLAGQPPIDLCIRTGNEMRLSNFFLWQLAYTELYFSKLYWPDFNEQAFARALANYQRRSRRFGLTSIE